MKKLKRLALQAIVASMEDLLYNLQQTSDSEEIKTNVAGLKALAEAFATISTAK